MICLSVALQFIWRIEIADAGIYLGEINRYLKESGIDIGTHKSALDTDAICNDLLHRLPRVAWVRAATYGTTLRISIVQGTWAPEMSKSPGDIIAAEDGVIEAIDVYSGTAVAQAGQTLHQGEILIKGADKGDYDGALTPVRVNGRVLARIWRQEEADIRTAEITSTPTGRKINAQRILSPWYTFTAAEAPDCLTYDTEMRLLPVGGAWIPVWLEKTTYHEVALEETPRDLDEVKAEAGRLAMEKLVAGCNKNDEIIDKKLIFSMIEGDTIYAAATAELLADIGRFTPQTSD